jgi:NADH-quinone oxidoreductase subunit M
VPLFRTLAAVGLLGTLLTAGYFLWLIQRVNLGRVPDRWGGKGLGDLAPIEVAAWSPLIVLMVALGFVPGLILWLTSPSVTGWFTDLFTLAST